jgi:xylulokinase
VTVGIDIGTTAVKAVAVDEDGTILTRTRIPHAVRTPEPGAFEHDVDQVWRHDVVGALAEVAAAHDVAAVAVSAMVPSLGAVRPDGSAAGPGLLYGDHRGAVGERPAAAAGDAGELLAFLAWHVRESPEATGFWPAQAVANHALTGRSAVDTTVAMTADPLFGGQGWEARVAAGAGTDVSALPDIVAGTEPVGAVLPDRPAAGALVAGGTIDALAEQVVAGADEVGDVLVLCGTTLITWAVVEEWAEVEGLWTVPHTARGKVLLGGPSNAGGLFLDRVQRWLGPAAAGGLDDVGPADLPVWLPYVRGERTPLHRRDLRASLHDLALHHEPPHLLRAAYEATAFVVRHHLDLAAPAGAAPRRIVATGGGTQSATWMQSLADVTGLPVDVAAVPEGAALGAAFVARCTAGLERRMAHGARWARTAKTVEPRREWVEAATERYERFRMLTAAALER